MCPQCEQVSKADKISPVSLTAVQKSSTGIIWGEVSLMEGLPTQEDKAQAEASAVKTEKVVVEEPEGSLMKNIFTEIQLFPGTDPNTQLIEVLLLLCATVYFLKRPIGGALNVRN